MEIILYLCIEIRIAQLVRAHDANREVVSANLSSGFYYGRFSSVGKNEDSLTLSLVRVQQAAQYRGMEKWYLVWLITKRTLVRVELPQLNIKIARTYRIET